MPSILLGNISPMLVGPGTPPPIIISGIEQDPINTRNQVVSASDTGRKVQMDSVQHDNNNQSRKVSGTKTKR